MELLCGLLFVSAVASGLLVLTPERGLAVAACDLSKVLRGAAVLGLRVPAFLEYSWRAFGGASTAKA